MLPSVHDTPTRQFSVCAVTVTYGGRWHLLEQVLAYLCAQPEVTRVIVVDNGASYDLDRRVLDLCGRKAEIAGSGCNEGSARGFAIGMKAARAVPDAEFVWILDDDNLPEAGCLAKLSTAWNGLTAGQPADHTALLALRTDREYLRRIAAGANPDKVFARRNSFLDFHIIDAPRRVWRKLFGKNLPTTDLSTPGVKIPYGVYGGLLFHKTLLDRVGYPDEAFYLYGDDTDFTARITNSGGDLYLVCGCKIDDLDRSWQVGFANRAFSRLHNLATAPESRVYYSTRNGVIIGRRYMVTNWLMWRINMLIYMGILRFHMHRVGLKNRYRLLAQAVADGNLNRMGRATGLDRLERSL